MFHRVDISIPFYKIICNIKYTWLHSNNATFYFITDKYFERNISRCGVKNIFFLGFRYYEQICEKLGVLSLPRLLIYYIY